MVKKATLHEVARIAEVSPMTVSNFVNGKHHFMSETTRARVADAVEQLNYRPRTAGRNLRYAQNFSVGMIIVDDSPLFLADGFTTQVVSGLGNSLNEKGYTLQLEGIRRKDFEQAALLRLERTDGLCVMLSGNAAQRRGFLEATARMGQPLVLFLEAPAKSLPDLCCVRQDDRAGGRQLADHLLTLGAKRFLVGKHSLNRWAAVDQRVEGVAEAIAHANARAAGAASMIVVACGSGGFEDTQAAIDKAIKGDRIPDAFMGMSDQIGIAALKLFKDRGIEVPDQVMVTGFNAFDFWRYSDPLLTTVRSPGYELGRVAGQAMVRRLETGAFAATSVTLPVELVLGESTPIPIRQVT